MSPTNLLPPRLFLLLLLGLAGCGDGDQVNPSNPDAGPTKDASGADGSRDSGHDAAKDAGKKPEDARADTLPE